MKKLKVGSRGSKLAVTQAGLYLEVLKSKFPEAQFEIVEIQTSGDRFANLSPQEVLQKSGKGIFVKELEEALLAGRVDFAIHSLKDMPNDLPAGLMLVGYQKRHDPRDAFVGKSGAKLLDLPLGAKIGTSSLRRRLQMMEIPGVQEKNFEFLALRGNVDTRLRKVKEGDLDGAVLSLAGLTRLGLEGAVSQVFDPAQEVVPACGQGTLVAEIREDRKDLFEMLTACQDQDTVVASIIERMALRTIGGGCLDALGIFCRPGAKKEEIELYLYHHDEGEEAQPGQRAHWILTPAQAQNLIAKLSAIFSSAEN